MSVDETKSPGADRGYAVGYGKPPVDTRFQKGQSGNPKGRRAGSRNMKTAISRELDAYVTVTENGKRTKKRKREVIAAQLVNKAAGADWKAVSLLLPILGQIDNERLASEMQSTDQDTMADADARVLASLRERFAQGERLDG